MLEQRRLDARMYDAIAKYMPADIVPDSGLDMEVLVEAGLAAFNEFYGEEKLRSNPPCFHVLFGRSKHTHTFFVSHIMSLS